MKPYFQNKQMIGSQGSPQPQLGQHFSSLLSEDLSQTSKIQTNNAEKKRILCQARSEARHHHRGRGVHRGGRHHGRRRQQGGAPGRQNHSRNGDRWVEKSRLVKGIIYFSLLRHGQHVCACLHGGDQSRGHQRLPRSLVPSDDHFWPGDQR